MKRLIMIAAVLALSAACSSPSPTAPSTSTPAKTSTPAAATLTSIAISGGPCNDGGTCQVPGPLGLTATARFSDGTTSNVTSTATWSSSNGGVVTVSSTGAITPHGAGGSADVTAVYQGKLSGVTVLVPAPWTTSGSGNTVLDMPTYISRIRIQGSTPSSCQNFIVHFLKPGSSTNFVVNVILGTCSVADARTYDGVSLTNNYPTVEIVSSTGINWTFTEQRQ